MYRSLQFGGNHALPDSRLSGHRLESWGAEPWGSHVLDRERQTGFCAEQAQYKENDMRKFYIPAAVGIMALSTSLAFAEGIQGSPAYGDVASWNAQDHVLRLGDGSTYILPSSYNSPTAFHWGEYVKVNFGTIGKVGTNYASSVTPIPKEGAE
jgi:hypothetical protein